MREREGERFNFTFVNFTFGKLERHYFIIAQLELVEKYHYNPELHKVVTEDGYILELHRIKGRNATSGDVQKPVALVMHGLLADSSVWVLSGTEKSLGKEKTPLESNIQTFY